VLLWVLGGLGVLALGLLLLVLNRDFFFRRLAERRVAEATGLKTEIAEFRTRLGHAEVAIRGFKLHNAPEYGGGVMVDMPELLLRLDAEAASAGKLRFEELRLHLESVSVVNNGEAGSNFSALQERLRRLTQRDGAQPPQVEFHGIDELRLTLGTIRLADLRRPRQASEVRLGLENEVFRNLKTEADLQAVAGKIMLKVLLQQALTPRP
jgi:hypothetical protein